jgi:hypothetical protein
VVGFHYYSIVVDGAAVADPATRTFFGSGWENSGIEIPEAAAWPVLQVRHPITACSRTRLHSTRK